MQTPGKRASKRKLRDGDDCDEAQQRSGAHAHSQPADLLEAAASRVQKHKEFPPSDKELHFSIPGLRIATESWEGLKASNEDRHVVSEDYFPGPVVGIFDGHGGTFSCEFLAKHLVKNVASALRQQLGVKALAGLQTVRELSLQEAERKRAIVDQLGVVTQQLDEVRSLQAPGTREPVEKATKGENADVEDELLTLPGQLAHAIEELQDGIHQINEEEKARMQQRQQWLQQHHGCFQKAFTDAFKHTDEQVLRKSPGRDGSTALLVWFLSDAIGGSEDEESTELSFYTANLGDCRAVLCRGGSALRLTSDHKPDRADERQRIEKAGGFVSKMRGISRVYSAAGAGLGVQRESSTYLAVSRAFGDRTLKIPTPLVSCEPEISHFQVARDDLFLVVACDGIWDVLSDQEAVDIAMEHIQDPKAAADAIVKASYMKGSADNLTATVVQFGWKSDALVQRVVASWKRSCAAESKKAHNGTGGEGNDLVGDKDEIDMFNL